MASNDQQWAITSRAKQQIKQNKRRERAQRMHMQVRISRQSLVPDETLNYGQYLMEHTGLVSKVVLTNCFFSPSFRPSRRNVLIHLKDHTVASIPIHTVLVVDSHHGSQPFLARCAMRAMMMKIVKHPTVRTIKSL